MGWRLTWGGLGLRATTSDTDFLWPNFAILGGSGEEDLLGEKFESGSSGCWSLDPKSHWAKLLKLRPRYALPINSVSGLFKVLSVMSPILELLEELVREMPLVRDDDGFLKSHFPLEVSSPMFAEELLKADVLEEEEEGMLPLPHGTISTLVEMFRRTHLAAGSVLAEGEEGEEEEEKGRRRRRRGGGGEERRRRRGGGGEVAGNHQ